MQVDAVVRGGTLVTEDGVFSGDVAIAGGRIAAILMPGAEVSAAEVIDARGLHVLPGLIDVHVHFNEPGRTEWEGFATGSQAAAAGGVTTFLEMPLNSLPPTLDAAGLATKRAAVAGKAVVDYAFWGGLVDDNVGNLAGLLAGGAIGCKAFTCASGVPEYPRCGEGLLFEGMRELARLGGVLGVHAESDELTARLGARLRAAGRRDARAWAESRPPLAEALAVGSVLQLAEASGARVHFVHVSTPEAVRSAAAARKRGVAVTLETCPHYLALDDDDLARLGPLAKCAPPLRPRPLVEELWRCLLSGLIDCVASDHSPCTVEEKHLDAGDIWRAWGGIAGVQTMLPLLLTEGCHRRGLSLPLLVRLTSGNPARLFGLAPRKGTLQPGADADLTLVCLDEEWVLQSVDLLTRNRLSPFIGHRFIGRVRQTLVRGRAVFRAGRIVAPPGHGREVPRA